MKIAIVTDEFPPASRGGSGVVAWREAKALVKRGHEVRVFTPGTPGNQTIEGIDVCFLGSSDFKKRSSWQAIFDHELLDQLKKPMADYGPDVVHCHHLISFFGLKTAEWCVEHYKTVATVHDANWVVPDKVWVNDNGQYEPNFFQAFFRHHLQYNPFLSVLAGRLFRRLSTVIFVSDVIRNYYEDVFGKQVNFKTLHNALELDEWPQEPLTSDGIIRIGFASRLTSAKGGGVFVSLIEELNNLGLPAIGSFIGPEDRFQQAMSAMADHLKPKFEYAGFLKSDEELRQWYKQISASFVGSLYLDPFPNVTLESLACGRGVIVGPYTGSREIVDTEVGYLLSAGDLADMSLVAKTLAYIKPFATWSQNCLEKRDGLGMDDHIQKLTQIYQGL